MKKPLLAIVLITSVAKLSFAQQRVIEKIEINQKPKEITTEPEKEVSSGVKTLVFEVFRDCPEVVTDRKLQDYEEILQRSSIISVNELPQGEKLLSLSSKILRTKCNADLTRDNASTFSEENFNPLKYIINFHAVENQYFLIDGTQKVLFIRATK